MCGPPFRPHHVAVLSKLRWKQAGKLRRVLLGALLVIPLVVMVSGAALIWGLPRLARQRAESALRDGLGLKVHIADVSAGLSWVALRGVRMKTPGGGAFSLEAEKLVLGFNPFRLLLEGASALASVEGGGIRCQVALQDQALDPLVSKIVGKKTDGGTSRRSGRQKDMHFKDFSLVVSDADGQLIALDGRSARLDDGIGTAAIERLEVGANPGSVIALSDVGVRVKRSDDGFAVEMAEVGKAHVRLAEQRMAQAGAPAAEPDVASSSKRDAQRNRGAQQKEAQGDQPAATGYSGGDDGVPDTRARLRRAATRLAQLARGRSDGPKTAVGKLRRQHSLLSSIGEDTKIELRDAVIAARVEGDSRVILRGLRAGIRGGAAGDFRLEGEGRAQPDGAVEWDLRLWPREFRADGTVSLRSLPLPLVVPFLPAVPWHEPDKSRVDARLVLSIESAERLAVRGQVELANAAIFSPRIAPAPVRDLEVRVEGQGHWFPGRRRLEIETAQMQLGRARVQLAGALEWTPEHYLIDLKAELPPTECSNAVSAIPSDLMGELMGLEFGGSIAGEIAARVDSRDLDKTVLEFRIRDRCEFLTVPAMADLRRFRMPFMHYVLEPDGSVFQMETGPGAPAWTPLESVSAFLVHAVVAHEDAGFFRHAGFSPAHVRNALVRNLREGRYAVGASTITMQLVKNLFLRREKTLARKVQEVLLTWWVERVLEKRDILELYLNVIEYGPSVYGIRHAARYYFNRLPAELSPAEAVYFSTILPNPKRYHTHLESGSVPARWAERMQRLLERLGEKGWYSRDAVAYGMSELGNLRFYPGGAQPPMREIPGGTSPLPYMADFDKAWDWPVDDAAENARESRKQKSSPEPRASSPQVGTEP